MSTSILLPRPTAMCAVPRLTATVGAALALASAAAAGWALHDATNPLAATFPVAAAPALFAQRSAGDTTVPDAANVLRDRGDSAVVDVAQF